MGIHKFFIISIHALRKESDRYHAYQQVFDIEFQSTLSVRRATIVVFGVVKEHVISIHALRKESDLLDLIRYFGIAKTISIHALRKESDGKPLPQLVQAHISIHALRKESDSMYFSS